MRTAASAMPGAQDEGVTLIEVIVAITLFALVAAGAGAMVLTGVATSRDARNRTLATAVAAEQLELARGTSVTSFLSLAAAPTTTLTRTVSGVPFTVTQTTAFLPKNSGSAACANTGQGGNAGVQPLLLVSESVTWGRMDRTTAVTTSTTVKPPIKTYSTATGGIDVKVLDQAGNPVPNLAVTVVGGAVSQSLTTNASGCAYAAYLAAGTYTVSVSAANYVDNQEATTSTQTVAVISGQVTNKNFLYAVGAEVDVTYAASPAPAGGLPVTVGNSALAGTASYTSANGTTAFKPLYPYSSYGIWAGRCPEAYPSAVNAANAFLYTGPPATTSVAPLSGQAVSVAVPLYPLQVTVKDAGGLLLTGAQLTLRETAGIAKTACAAPFNSYGLTPSAAGTSLTGVPLGSFTLTVTYAGRTATASVRVVPAGLATTVTV